MRIVVLAGGISTERDVSLSSGAMIYRALKERGHQAVLLDVYLGYRWEEEAFPDVSEGERPGAVFGLKKDWAKEMGKIEEKKPERNVSNCLRRRTRILRRSRRSVRTGQKISLARM